MSFTDFIALQNDFAHLLLCDPWLAPVNIVTRHRLLENLDQLPDETYAAEVLAYITPRNQADGRTGAGVIIEQPEVEVNQAVSPGPQKDIILTALVLEEPLANNGPQTGTLLAADQIAQRILEVGHLWSADDLGDLHADRNAIAPAKDFEPLRAFRVKLRFLHSNSQTARISLPAIAIDGSFNVTLTTPSEAPNSQLYYVLLPGGVAPDHSATFPGRSNPAAVKYTGAFPTQAGDVVRWAAHDPDFLPSRIGRATINA